MMLPRRVGSIAVVVLLLLAGHPARADHPWGGGYYTNLHGGPSGCMWGQYQGCNPDPHSGPSCNPDTGSCSAPGVVKFVCTGKAINASGYWECLAGQSGWSTSQNISETNRCDVTVQLDAYGQSGNWSTYQDHMVWYIPGGNRQCANGCSQTCSGSAWGACPPKDCAGTCGGSATVDCAGVCGGHATVDCAGVCNGSAARDCAGVCNGSATRDCAGTCNGHAVPDCAGVCNGHAVTDCAGVCNGAAVCDCAGTCNGTAVIDCAGVCDGTAVVDCAGTCNGTAVIDCAGVCNGGAVPNCLGVCGGAAPECCPGDTAPCADGCDKTCGADGRWQACAEKDCAGVCGGDAVANCLGSCDGSCPTCCPGDVKPCGDGVELTCGSGGEWDGSLDGCTCSCDADCGRGWSCQASACRKDGIGVVSDDVAGNACEDRGGTCTDDRCTCDGGGGEWDHRSAAGAGPAMTGGCSTTGGLPAALPGLVLLLGLSLTRRLRQAVRQRRV